MERCEIDDVKCGNKRQRDSEIGKNAKTEESFRGKRGITNSGSEDRKDSLVKSGEVKRTAEKEERMAERKRKNGGGVNKKKGNKSVTGQRGGIRDGSRQPAKDDLLEVVIEDLGVDGEGIGKVNGAAFFVKDAVIGDKVLVKVMKMKKNYGYARMMEILEPSPWRVEPVCAFHRQCGGCQLQALDYRKQLEFKENKVKNNLCRIGGFDKLDFEPIIGMEQPLYYRNKAQFPIGRDREGNIVTGFYASRTHTIIPNRKCFLGSEVNESVLDIVIDFMNRFGIEPYDESTGDGLVRHVLIRKGFFTGEVMVCIVISGHELPDSESLVKELRKLSGMVSISLNVNDKKTNVILGDEIIPLWGQAYITDQIGGIQYQISPLSFFQVNPVQTEKLYDVALEYAGLTGNEIVWDLYCGIGTISLFLAQKAKKVYGVEIVPQAIDDARVNAKINGIENVEFFVGKAEEVLPEFYEKRVRDDGKEFGKTDVIVVDPPRKGCDEKCLETIVKMQPERVVYVSCDSATLARDLKYLKGEGYGVVRVRTCDMFGMTSHVECVCLLTRNK